MALVTMKSLLEKAKQGRYAVGAFNVCNLENAICVFESARQTTSPVIIQLHGSEVIYSRGQPLTDAILALGDQYREIDYAIHLDHGESFEEATKCVCLGFSSVMYDGSSLPFEENVEITKQVVQMAHAVGVTVEGELGAIGNTEFGEGNEPATLTDPKEAKEFCKQTGIDCLAASFGTAHGLYKSDPKLDFERIAALSVQTGLPIVMHGGTGVPEADIKKAISLGVAKINFSTILRKSFIDEMKDYLNQNPDDLMVMDIFNAGNKGMIKAIVNAMNMCGSSNKM